MISRTGPDDRIMNAREIIEVEDANETIGCDGGSGALGHPVIYLRLEGRPHVDCYYCSRRFVPKMPHPESAA